MAAAFFTTVDGRLNLADRAFYAQQRRYYLPCTTCSTPVLLPTETCAVTPCYLHLLSPLTVAVERGG
jgi:hypothetical protein